MARYELDSATIENVLSGARHCIEFAHGFRPAGWRKTGARRFRSTDVQASRVADRTWVSFDIFI